MKYFVSLLLFFAAGLALQAQSILGSWQLIRQTNCVEENMTAASEEAQSMVDEMKSMSPATPRVVTFKEKMAGEESIRILTKKKAANSKSFLYKFDDDNLVILDKKSHTITDHYLIDKFSADSLIISNASRPCETLIFLRIK